MALTLQVKKGLWNPWTQKMVSQGDFCGQKCLAETLIKISICKMSFKNKHVKLLLHLSGSICQSPKIMRFNMQDNFSNLFQVFHFLIWWQIITQDMDFFLFSLVKWGSQVLLLFWACKIVWFWIVYFGHKHPGDPFRFVYSTFAHNWERSNLLMKCSNW